MPSNPQHISKQSKPNDSCDQWPFTLSPPNVNPKNDDVLVRSLDDIRMKSSPKRLFFDQSSRMLIDTPPDVNGRFFVSLSPLKSLEKEEVVTSSEPKEQIMKQVLSLYPEEKFFESMMGMVRTRLECNLNVDSDYLEELLAFYLIHNEESFHGHIFSAYLRMLVDSSQTFLARGR